MGLRKKDFECWIFPAVAGHVTAWAGRAYARSRVDFELVALLRSVSVNLAELRRVLRCAIKTLQP